MGRCLKYPFMDSFCWVDKAPSWFLLILSLLYKKNRAGHKSFMRLLYFC